MPAGTARAMLRASEGGKTMHPIWVEMLQKPVGWLTIIGGVIIIALPFVVRAFIRKQMREEDKQRK